MLAGATGPMRDKYLLPLLQGQSVGSFGFTEPPDLAERTTAVKSADGTELVVTGVKSYVTGGADADWVAVMCGLCEADGVTKAGSAMVVVDTAAPGVTVQHVFHSLDADTYVKGDSFGVAPVHQPCPVRFSAFATPTYALLLSSCVCHISCEFRALAFLRWMLSPGSEMINLVPHGLFAPPLATSCCFVF
jgi:hypothetical protein